MCPAMRFFMFRDMGLKLGMGVGDGGHDIFEVAPPKVKDHPGVKYP